jgi:hypothetical protein
MTVFVIQDQNHVNPRTGQLEAKFDFTPAEQFGKLVYALKPSASPFDLEPVLAQLHKVLRGFCDNDYLLLTGNPVLIGLAVAIASDYNGGDINMLQWSGTKRQYIRIAAKNIYADEEN